MTFMIMPLSQLLNWLKCVSRPEENEPEADEARAHNFIVDTTGSTGLSRNEPRQVTRGEGEDRNTGEGCSQGGSDLSSDADSSDGEAMRSAMKATKRAKGGKHKLMTSRPDEKGSFPTGPQPKKCKGGQISGTDVTKGIKLSSKKKKAKSPSLVVNKARSHRHTPQSAKHKRRKSAVK